MSLTGMHRMLLHTGILMQAARDGLARLHGEPEHAKQVKPEPDAGGDNLHTHGQQQVLDSLVRVLARLCHIQCRQPRRPWKASRFAFMCADRSTPFNSISKLPWSQCTEAVPVCHETYLMVYFWGTGQDHPVTEHHRHHLAPRVCQLERGLPHLGRGFGCPIRSACRPTSLQTLCEYATDIIDRCLGQLTARAVQALPGFIACKGSHVVMPAFQGRLKTP